MKPLRGNPWKLVTSSNRDALAVVDGLGRFKSCGPHYSRRNPGSPTFTGVGQEIILLSRDYAAVWAVVRHRVPQYRGSGTSRWRDKGRNVDTQAKYVWRNMMFRNLGDYLSSYLIKFALAMTYLEWQTKYGVFPVEILRTEIDPENIKSTNPGCCYKFAGFHNERFVRGKLHMDAPCKERVFTGRCSCCGDSAWTEEDSRVVSYLLRAKESSP